MCPSGAISTCRLLFQLASTIKIQLSMLVQYKVDIVIIKSNLTCLFGIKQQVARTWNLIPDFSRKYDTSCLTSSSIISIQTCSTQTCCDLTQYHYDCWFTVVQYKHVVTVYNISLRRLIYTGSYLWGFHW
jgi:hypothetical protein